MTVGIVSPFTLTREMLCGLLANMQGIEVVLDVESAFESYELIHSLQPRMLLVDATSPAEDLDGLRQMKKLYRSISIVLLVRERNDEFEMRAIEAGARGCLARTCNSKCMERALHHVDQGEFWISRNVASLVAGRLVASHDPTCDLSRELTEREWAVLGLLAMGYVNKEIAAHLAISENTVKAHLASTYRKLGVTTRLGAVLHYFRQARQEGIPTSPFSRQSVKTRPASASLGTEASKAERLLSAS